MDLAYGSDPHLDQPALSPVFVAIPVRDEAARIGRLLDALAMASEKSELPVTALIFANNCTDHSGRIARCFKHPLLAVEVVEQELPFSSAGRARRIAMDIAARDDALLMMTDGDAVPGPEWIAASLRAIKNADLVCGMIEADCRHVLAMASGERITSAEDAYAGLLHEVRHAIDRIAGRQGQKRPHYVESAASMATRGHKYRMIGGLPDICSSEDRALVHLAECRGLSIRYADDMMARVSGRVHGRAKGGMAETLCERMVCDNPFADQATLPPEVLQMLWTKAISGSAPFFPTRAYPVQQRFRASDLEANLPVLAQFVTDTVRPQFDLWQTRDCAA